LAIDCLVNRSSVDVDVGSDGLIARIHNFENQFLALIVAADGSGNRPGGCRNNKKAGVIQITFIAFALGYQTNFVPLVRVDSSGCG
jgi:hypothetical protein